MGMTATIAGCLVGGALIGGGTVAYVKYRQKREEENQRYAYFRRLQDCHLQNRRVTARITSSY